ncbi:hypothetical protein I8H84_05200 [Candidatus Saccharibacteria bacterium]|nr:hypothetical protein [Candidatus Saccharibacteria bacterium]MBH1973267.1 hypothetical protein [Candidatus Saccharibacteria bacterium]MBH1990492.1 hypothetical protein [Candidatus Saccharibacteria bacterium]
MTVAKNSEPALSTTSVHDFYFETPLYSPIDLDSIEGDIYSGTVDGFSSIDNRDTTYSINMKSNGEHWNYYDNIISIRLRDKRTDSGDLFFFLYVSDDDRRVVKIGQAPSLATIQFADIAKKYKDVLGKQDISMLKRAIGLAAHGTGIGSFVYLRRILESLIWETYNAHKDALVVSEQDFKAERTKDKIKILKRYLPASMSKMTPLYGILSKGIHELDEKECLAYFDTMKLAIELILRQKIQQKQEQDEEAETIRRLREATQQLAQKDGKND